MTTSDDELKELRKAVLNEPRNAELRYLLGTEMAQQRDYDGAVLEMSAAIALNPFLHIARLQLGLLHLTLAQPKHTLAVLAPLEDLGGTSPLKHFKRGLEALIVDDFPTCVAMLRKGIELNSDNPPLNRDMQLIIDRVTSVQASQQAAATNPAGPSAPSEQSRNAVRTDFSLYGITRH